LDLDEASKLDQLDKSIDYSEAIKAVQALSFEIKCLTIEYFSDQILNLLESLYGPVPINIMLKKCFPPIEGFTGSVLIEKKRNFLSSFN
jgi:dihydroneopterin aldolase